MTRTGNIKPTFGRSMAALAALLLAGTATGAHAQWSDSGPGGGGAPQAGASSASDTGGGARAKRGERRSGKRQVDISPYLEVGQVLSADLKNGGDVLTYTNVAVGVDASVVTHRAELAASVRYEHQFGWSKNMSDQDVISGLLRGRFEAARGVNLEAGALATRTRADGLGSGLIDGDSVGHLYSVYAGPTVTQQIGGLDVGAGYRFGYTKFDVETPVLTAPDGATRQNFFDDSTNHVAWASVGQRPGALPFGWQVSGGYEREDASQLDQRYEGKYARADVTLPVSSTLALLGGVGYEKIEISQRAAVLDENNLPVIDAGGRYVTDPASPRQLAFETDGLIWDAGVMWQPSRRTSLTARVGRRYGDTVYTGSLTYRADHATTVQVGVYDGLSSFGRGMSGGLAALPTQFDPTRNPITGDIDDCVFGSEGGGCLTPQFGSATAAQYRNRGVQAIVTSAFGGWHYGVGAGYDRRRLLVPPTSAIAVLNGVTEENYYLFLTAGRRLDADSDIGLTGYLNYLDSGVPGAGDVKSAGISTHYSRRFWRSLSGTAAASLDAFDRDGFNTQLIGSALVGLRYNF